MFVNRLNNPPSSAFCYPVIYSIKKFITCVAYVAYNCFYIIFINYFSCLRLEIGNQCFFFSSFIKVIINVISIFIPCFLFNSSIRKSVLSLFDLFSCISGSLLSIIETVNRITETSPYSFGNFRKLSLYNYFMPI